MRLKIGCLLRLVAQNIVSTILQGFLLQLIVMPPVQPYVLIERAASLPHFQNLRTNLTAPSSSRSSSSGIGQDRNALESRVETLEQLVRTLSSNQERLQRELDRRSSSRSTGGSHSVATGPPPSPQFASNSPGYNLHQGGRGNPPADRHIFLPNSSYSSTNQGAVNYAHLLSSGNPSPNPMHFRFPDAENRDILQTTVPPFQGVERSPDVIGSSNSPFMAVFEDPTSFLHLPGSGEALDDLDLPLMQPRPHASASPSPGARSGDILAAGAPADGTGSINTTAGAAVVPSDEIVRSIAVPAADSIVGNNAVVTGGPSAAAVGTSIRSVSSPGIFSIPGLFSNIRRPSSRSIAIPAQNSNIFAKAVGNDGPPIGTIGSSTTAVGSSIRSVVVPAPNAVGDDNSVGNDGPSIAIESSPKSIGSSVIGSGASVGMGPSIADIEPSIPGSGCSAPVEIGTSAGQMEGEQGLPSIQVFAPSVAFSESSDMAVDNDGQNPLPVRIREAELVPEADLGNSSDGSACSQE